jgi:hypothetical protein
LAALGFAAGFFFPADSLRASTNRPRGRRGFLAAAVFAEGFRVLATAAFVAVVVAAAGFFVATAFFPAAFSPPAFSSPPPFSPPAFSSPLPSSPPASSLQRLSSQRASLCSRWSVFSRLLYCLRRLSPSCSRQPLVVPPGQLENCPTFRHEAKCRTETVFLNGPV